MIGVPEIYLSLLCDIFSSEFGVSLNSDPVFPRNVCWLGLERGSHEIILAAVDRQVVDFSYRFPPLSVHDILLFFISGIDGGKSIRCFRVHK